MKPDTTSSGDHVRPLGEREPSGSAGPSGILGPGFGAALMIAVASVNG